MANFDDIMVIDYDQLQILADEQKIHSYITIFEAYYEHKLSPFFTEIAKYPEGLDPTTVRDIQLTLTAILKEYKQQYGRRFLLSLITDVLVSNRDYRTVPHEIRRTLKAGGLKRKSRF